MRSLPSAGSDEIAQGLRRVEPQRLSSGQDLVLSEENKREPLHVVVGRHGVRLCTPGRRIVISLFFPVDNSAPTPQMLESRGPQGGHQPPRFAREVADSAADAECD